MVFHLKSYKGKTINEALNHALSIPFEPIVSLPPLVLY